MMISRSASVLRRAPATPALDPSILTTRFFSTVPHTLNENTEKSTTGGGCPYSAHTKKDGASTTTSPQLRHVPSLPFVGSMIPQHSDLPPFEMHTQYATNNEIRRKFGNFMTLGFPGFGRGSHGTIYNIFDPNEMMKIVRSEGDRPSGIVEKIWQWKRAMKDADAAIISKKPKDAIGPDGEEYDYGLFDNGDGWKRQRTFLQTGMLDPNAARGFIPGIVEAATQASKAAPLHASNVNEYLNYTAFDMFCSFMFGAQMRTTSTIVSSDPDVRAGNAENERFVSAALGMFHVTNTMSLKPTEYLMARFLPFYKSDMYKELQRNYLTVREVGLKKIHEFIERYDRNELNEMERASYLAGAIERQRATNELSQDEMVELCLTALFVGVDTTSSVTAWNLMHLAMNPDVQEKLHSELATAVKLHGSDNGTKLNAEVLGRKIAPYLHMCIRESHRITPAFAAAMWKGNSKTDVQIHDEIIPKGSQVQLGHVTYDPEYVDQHSSFIPERWEVDEVNERKGTKSEVIDHPFLRDPFSQGARRCPGSRVANNEILSMIGQLVLDWKIGLEEGSGIEKLEDVRYDSSPIKPIFPKMTFEARE